MAAPAELEHIVREELRPVVAELVRRLVPELVAEQLNGRAERPPNATNGLAATPDPSPSTKVCKACGRVLPVDQFERHRGVCRECRRRQRATAPATEEEPGLSA